jgi:hypothetical protein
LGAKYVVVGGLAIIQAGYFRLTGDIDLLIDPSLENEAKVFQALQILPDKAVNSLDPGDVSRFTVVRIADDLVVDLIASSCGVTFDEAIQDAVFQEVEGTRIPFASPKALWKMKQTVREKDVADRMFLEQLLTSDSEPQSGLFQKLKDSLNRIRRSE